MSQKLIQISLIIAILSVVAVLGGVYSGDAHAEPETHASPFQQQRDGVPLASIQCNVPRDLHIRDSQTPVCITPSTYELLLGYGMDLVPSQQSARTVTSITGAGDPETRSVVGDYPIRRDLTVAVDGAIAMYLEDGENAFARIGAIYAGDPAAGISSPAVLPGIYPFVIDPASGQIVGSPGAGESVPAGVDYGDLAAAMEVNDQIVWLYSLHAGPETGVDEQELYLGRMHDGYIFGAGYSYPAEEKVRSLVQRTVALYEADRVSALAGINRQPADLNPHYLFVLDTDTSGIVAHGASPADRVGTPSAILDDPNVLAGLQGGSGIWVEHEDRIPGTDLAERKRSYLQLHDGYVFGAGYYHATFSTFAPSAFTDRYAVTGQSFARTINSITDAGDPEVQRVVEETVRMYDSEGENAFVSIDALSENAVPHYPIVLDADTGRIVAHGAFPESVGGQPTIPGDLAAVPSATILEGLRDSGGAWSEYIFVDPATSTDNLKRSWLALHDGYIFAAGYTYPVQGEIARTVEGAIAMYAEGGENAFARIGAIYAGDPAAGTGSTPVRSGIYPFVIEPASGQIVGSPGAGGSVPAGVDYGDLAAAMEVNDQIVRLYSLHADPETGVDEQGLYLGRMHDGYIFGAGYSYPVEEKVRSLVQRTVALYEADGAATLAGINRQPADLNPHYLLVLDTDTSGIVAHGASPADRVGTPSAILDDPNVLAGLQGGSGIWVEHEDRIPGTDLAERKRSYLQLHDGYAFGAGYYYATFPTFESATPAAETGFPHIYADPAAAASPRLEFESPHHVFDMKSGNAMYSVIIPHTAGWFRQDITPNANDAPLIFRIETVLLNAAFDATAPYHPTAVGIYSRIEHRPASESEDNLLPNAAVMYSIYRSMLEFAPDRADEWRFMMTVHGLDPDADSGLDLDCGDVHDLDSPAAIGNLAAMCVLDARRDDGFNHLGYETSGTPFGDTTGYRPHNPPNTLNDPSRWQPLLVSGDGDSLKTQTFVTPQWANTEPYSGIDPRSIRVPPPSDSDHENRAAYRAQVDEVLELTRNLTDEKKMTAEFFDNKIRGALVQPALKNIHDVVEYVQLDFLLHMAEFDMGIVTWQEKARYDAVRPVTAIGYLYDDEPMTIWSTAGQEPLAVPANEWRSYLDTADHPEYPSATTSFCAAYAEVWRHYSGTDTIPEYVGPRGELIPGYGTVYPAGSSVVERGITPVNDVTISFDSWSDYAEQCAASRVISGTHFWPAVEESLKTGRIVGAAAFEYWETLIHDEPPIREAAQELEPDPMLDRRFWTGR